MIKDLQITPSRTVVTSFNPKTTTASQQQQQQQQNQHGDYLSNSNNNNNNNNNNSNNDDMNNFFEEGDWVLCVTSAEQWISCALSNGEIQVYDKNKLLQINCYTTTTNEVVTDLCRDYYNPNLLAATATDGTVTIFDIRQQQQQQPICQMRCPRQEEEALSVSIGYDGTIAAVGSSKAKIHFFDMRNTKGLVGSYSQTHTKDISRVRFQTIPSSFGTATTTTPILLSGAEDGLACLFDTSKSSEEEALANIFSVQSPVREVGFFGTQSEGIYALTGSESLLLYHKDDSVCRKNYGPELRTYLSQQIIGNNNNKNKNSSSGSSSALPHLEYLVDCHWDASRQELLLLAGTVKGDAGIYRLNVNAQDVGMPSLVHHLHGGHRGVIRAWHPLSSSSSSMFVTVGEDARMCEWNRFERQIHSAGRSPIVIVAKPQQQQQRSTTAPAVVHRPGGGKLRRPRSRFSGAASPY